jgi:hypothetical protein
MDIFRFNKPDIQAPLITQDTKEQQAPPLPPPPPQEQKKEQKDDASDFFHINIYNVFIHDPEFVEKCDHVQGQTVEKYTLKLSKPELSTFDQVHILKYENGNYDLHFTGNVEELTAEMIDFVNYCASVLGPDFMQKTSYAGDKDARDMRLGIFSRVWPKQVRIENIYFTLSLTLYDIPSPKSRMK